MLTSTDELTIRKSLADRAALITGAPRIIPAPIYFVDEGEFHSSSGLDFDIQESHDILVSAVKFCSIYLKSWDDDQDSTLTDSPLINLEYEYYVFFEYHAIRADENLTPDAFNKKMLQLHNDFIKFVVGLKADLQGERNISGLDPLTFSSAKTSSLTIREEMQNRVQCEFIPNVLGHQIRLGETVRVQVKEC